MVKLQWKFSCCKDVSSLLQFQNLNILLCAWGSRITHEELFIEHAIRGLPPTVCDWPWVSVWLLMSCLSNPWLINEINAKSTPLSYCALWALSPMIKALPMVLKPLSYGDCWISFAALMFLSFQFRPWLFSTVSSTGCIEPWTLLGFRLPLSLFLYANSIQSSPLGPRASWRVMLFWSMMLSWYWEFCLFAGLQ